MGFDNFAPYLKINGCFIVRNITPDRNKTIRIFGYPILFNQTRDLLAIPGVSEAGIRGSLLKGELQHKIRAGDIVIECSDVDLLQFNSAQKEFLQNAGITGGLEVGNDQLDDSVIEAIITDDEDQDTNDFNRIVLETSGTVVYIGDGDIVLKT